MKTLYRSMGKTILMAFSFMFTLTALSSQAMAWERIHTPVITSTVTATGTMGQPFAYQITATNSPTSFAAIGLPTGLSINTLTGLISGIPAAAGSSMVTLEARNYRGTGYAHLSLTIQLPPPVSVQWTPVDVINSSSSSADVSVFGFPDNTEIQYGLMAPYANGLKLLPWNNATAGQVKTISTNVMYQDPFVGPGWRMARCQIQLPLTQTLEVALQIVTSNSPLPGDLACSFYVYRQ
jgi:hypothetical protein